MRFGKTLTDGKLTETDVIEAPAMQIGNMPYMNRTHLYYG